MNISGNVSAILAQKTTSNVWSIQPDATVFDAIALMAEKNIGALPVLSGGRLVGIITERDYTRNVVLKGRSSKETAVNEIMSRDLILAAPGDPVADYMKLMTDRKVRHIPVVEGGRLVGVVSIGDIVRWVMEVQAATIDQLESYVTGGAAG